MPSLSSPDVLVFAAPIVLALLLWLFTVTGVGHGHDGLHADDGGGFGDLFGAMPLTLAATVLLFAFGWIGLALRLGAGLGLGWSVAVALVGGYGVTRGAARLLRPLFRPQEAPRATALVGKVGIVTSERVDDRFGTASIRVDGARVDVAVRLSSDLPVAEAPAYGASVLLYDFDPARNVYLAAPHPA